jgi:hypothetical protein
MQTSRWSRRGLVTGAVPHGRTEARFAAGPFVRQGCLG